MYKKPYTPIYHEISYDEPENYKYEYGVADEPAVVSSGQIQANSSSQYTNGEYRVVLPDCKIDVEKYPSALGYSGQIVGVTYEGNNWKGLLASLHYTNFC